MSSFSFRLLLPALLLWLASTGQAQAIAPIQQWRMDNGLRVLLMEAHHLPMVVLRLTVPAGSAMDAPGKEGTASLLAAMLGDHTARHGHRAWADLLDAEAIRFGVGADRDALSFSATTLVEALPETVTLLDEAVRRPGWDGKRFAILRNNARSALRKSLEQPRVRAAIASLKLLYGDHPYGHRISGTPESLGGITMADLQRLYTAQVKPQGAVLAVSGDVTMAQLKRLLAPLAGWHGAPRRMPADLPRPQPRPAASRHIAMPTHQTTVQLVRLGPDRHDRDIFPTLLMNEILGGGGFASQLMREVREKRGLVYGVYSYFEPLARPGPFVITLQTRNDQTREALTVVEQVMASMAAGKITAQALRAAKEHLIGGFAHRIDANAKRVALMSMIGFYDLPLDYLTRWRARIGAVTLAQVRQMAARYLPRKGWSTITVGGGP
ncbi:MAG: insulinase family protein [Zetaproteobacteria bacterium]|nr:MAG: insulinase family protein [Zetaproteobacteria bacterium]